GRVPKSNSEAAIKSYSYSTVVSHCENIYYQIKSVDFDGHVDYSDIINVQNDASTCKLNVFPHPVTQGFLNVTNMAPYTGSMLKVISLQGQTLREMPITSEGTGVRIDTRNLQTGMYFLQVGNLKPEKIFIINN
ncbi:MAG: T9SS type A sorting domain-containing protein, partial [Cytophagales bacterium]|nr:T9SS type A sorting domain-containing protein [Cytophagales bacterium]